MPARAPALRDEPVAPPHLRLAMLETAVRATAGLRVVDVELRRPGTSYTIDTLEVLRATHPAEEPWWVVGADAARHIHEWHRSDELLADPASGGRAARRLAALRRCRGARAGARPRANGGPRPDAARGSARPRCAAASREANRSPGWCRAPVADIISASGLYRSAPVR